MKRLFLLLFVLLAISCEEPQVDTSAPLEDVITLKGGLDNSREIILKSGPDAIFYDVESTFTLANCRPGPTQIIMIEGEEVYKTTVTCDKICGYFWCGTITF